MTGTAKKRAGTFGSNVRIRDLCPFISKENEEFMIRWLVSQFLSDIPGVIAL